jgi:adenylate cyclase
VGRSDECDLVLPLKSVSKQHARLTPTPGGAWELEDLGSRNGTLVDGQPLSPGERGALADGSQLWFGAYRALFLGPAGVQRLLRSLSGEG